MANSVAIIGAGPAGLVSAKYLILKGFHVTIYEQNHELGGVWAYTDEIGTNEYGLKVHTAMYQGLRTNIPVPLMEFPDFHLPNDIAPFPSQPDILNYLHSYANHFDLNQYIKFNNVVIRVRPIENDRWEIVVHDLLNDNFITTIYDAVFVCNGHFFEPFIPNNEGVNEFKGKLLHSHTFRSADQFQDDEVLVVGIGPSGVDLALMLSKVAKSTTISRKKHQNKFDEACKKIEKSLESKVTFKDEIKRFTADGVEFIDGSQQTFTAIIYATGYKYSLPFLNIECDVRVKEKFVQPLYKHIININHPTMYFIGLIVDLPVFLLMDLQAQFAVKFLSGEKKLPTPEEMMQDFYTNTQAHWAKGFPKWKTHYLIGMEDEYQKQLTSVADLKPIPEVYLKIAYDTFQNILEKTTEFREYKYTVIDEHNFERVKLEN